MQAHLAGVQIVYFLNLLAIVTAPPCAYAVPAITLWKTIDFNSIYNSGTVTTLPSAIPYLSEKPELTSSTCCAACFDV